MIHKEKAALKVQGHGKGLLSSEIVRRSIFCTVIMGLFVTFCSDFRSPCLSILHYFAFLFLFWVHDESDTDFFFK